MESFLSTTSASHARRMKVGTVQNARARVVLTKSMAGAELAISTPPITVVTVFVTMASSAMLINVKNAMLPAANVKDLVLTNA